MRTMLTMLNMRLKYRRMQKVRRDRVKTVLSFEKEGQGGFEIGGYSQRHDISPSMCADKSSVSAHDI